MKTRFLLLALLAIVAGCKDNGNNADAYGNFEATEIIISPEVPGKIIRFNTEEGSQIGKGDIVAIIDTALLSLQKAEMDATMKSVRTRITSINAQNAVLEQQIANLNVDISRVERMLKDEAATQKQLDDLAGQATSIRKQIDVSNTQKESVIAELSVIESKKATIDEQIRRCQVTSPLKGSVIETYAEAGEIAAAGKPVAKIADLSVVTLKAYVSGGQLADVKTGAKCNVRIDDGAKGFREFEGTVRYISEKSEFTPKIIQTKEDRVTMVYAVEISVVNDGSIKAGMPGEAIF
ncbi:MAG: efflux RND transporter periplasmic adaptor subunit [Bacteroidales bacterium]|jgi:HlyD family secretion protein|nr:efflux RND transporter periplasmic adaptor subunit [Bacteroidales bacterium]